jgi:hypothetical protein
MSNTNYEAPHCAMVFMLLPQEVNANACYFTLALFSEA